MDQEDTVSFWSKAFYESALVMTVSWYLWKLNNLNKSIKKMIGKSTSFESACKVISYDDYAALWYAFGAFAFVAISVIFTIWFFQAAQQNNFSWQFILLLGMSFLLNVILIILILKLINNPILRAIIVVIIVGIGLLVASSSGN